MVERVISTLSCLAEGVEWLASVEPRLAYAVEQLEEVPLRLRSDGFEALLSAIVSQQISVAAAAGIWKRIEAAGANRREAVFEMSDDELLACGLSRSKVKYARALAESELDFEAFRELPTDEVVKELIEIKGIGRWTAEIYAMFSLGRADAFAAGDLALQESARVLFSLEARPTERELRQMAQSWSPWKSVAARILFAYYRVIKDREGLR